MQFHQIQNCYLITIIGSQSQIIKINIYPIDRFCIYYARLYTIRHVLTKNVSVLWYAMIKS